MIFFSLANNTRKVLHFALFRNSGMAFFKNSIILLIFAPKLSIVFNFSSSKEKSANDKWHRSLSLSFTRLICFCFLDPTVYPSLQPH